MPRIKLEKLENCRDLGGFPVTGGYRVKNRKLIRSEALFAASENDLKILTDEYGLRTVVDFRTDIERNQKPDPDIEGVENIFNPIVVAETLGITRERVDYRDLPKIFEGMSGEPLEYMENLYCSIALDEYSREHYRSFFSVLLSERDGSVLWHCSAGKDRVGIGTALLLSALGAEREDIIKDYLMTGHYYRFTNFKLKTMIAFGVRDRKVRNYLNCLLDVKREYIAAVFKAIDSKYGSLDAYLEKEMNLGSENRARLRELYLEKV